MAESIATFSYMVSTVSPLPLLALRESPIASAVTAAIVLPVFILVYYAVNIKWDFSGFYGISIMADRRLGKAQLIVWTISYSLYVVYTSFFIPFYLLNMSGYEGIAFSFLIFALSSLITFSGVSRFFFVFSALFQIALMIPLGWVPSMSTYQPQLQGLFVNVLSSGLLLVCITLVPYWNGKREDSKLIFLALAVSVGSLITGGFFESRAYIAAASSVGYFSLIVAEYRSIRDLYRFALKSKLSDIILFVAMLLAMSAGSLSVYKFYFITSGVSVILLYPALLISLFSVLLLKKGFITSLSFTVAAALMLYGEYSAISFLLFS